MKSGNDRWTSLVLIGLAVCGLRTTILADPPAAEREGPRRRAVVVMKQAEVRGRVFFLDDKASADAVAAGLTVRVFKADTEKPLQETKTGADGCYTLKGLEAGTYRLTVGRLALDLKVLDPVAAGDDPARVPEKTILVFIPQDLGMD